MIPSSGLEEEEGMIEDGFPESSSLESSQRRGRIDHDMIPKLE
jgi:hypothetical protein